MAGSTAGAGGDNESFRITRRRREIRSEEVENIMSVLEWRSALFLVK